MTTESELIVENYRFLRHPEHRGWYIRLGGSKSLPVENDEVEVLLDALEAVREQHDAIRCVKELEDLLNDRTSVANSALDQLQQYHDLYEACNVKKAAYRKELRAEWGLPPETK